MKTITNTTGLAGKIFSAVLFFIFCAQISFANGDSTKIKNKKDGTEYPITDPRNPNCPCHKYQQLADDEYKKSQKQLSQNSKSNNVQLKRKKKKLLNFELVHFPHLKKHRHWRKPKLKLAECFVWNS